MTLDSNFAVVESLSFQIQFSVLSGIQSVQRALAQDETVQSLLQALTAQPKFAEQVFERIRHLMPLTKKDTGLSLDESIVAYLYCLKRHDLILAKRASYLIWDTGGLLWSCWLAAQIIEFTRQVEESICFKSVASHSYGFVSGVADDVFVAKSLSKSMTRTEVVRSIDPTPIEPSFAGER